MELLKLSMPVMSSMFLIPILRVFLPLPIRSMRSMDSMHAHLLFRLPPWLAMTLKFKVIFAQSSTSV